MKRKILFFAEPATLAHVARIVALAEMLPRGHYDVALACTDDFPLPLKDFCGKRVALTARSPKLFAQTLASGGCLLDEQVALDYVRNDLEIIDREQPDLIVGDFRVSLGVSAPAARVPYIAVTNAYWSPFLAQRTIPFPCLTLTERFLPKGRIGMPILQMLNWANRFSIDKILNFHVSGLNRARQEYGLAKFDDYFTGFTFGDEVLYSDAPELFSMKPLPDNHRFIGPIMWAPKIDMPPWWESLTHRRPLAYVNLGSSGPGQHLMKVLSTLSDMGWSVAAASAGHGHPNNLPANCFMAPFLPGAEVARRCDLMICNGGSPSVYQGLAAAVPVVGIAQNMDQLLFMQEVEKSGAGVLLRSDLFSPGLLRAACLRATELGAASRARSKLASTINNTDVAAAFNAVVERYVPVGELCATA